MLVRSHFASSSRSVWRSLEGAAFACSVASATISSVTSVVIWGVMPFAASAISCPTPSPPSLTKRIVTYTLSMAPIVCPCLMHMHHLVQSLVRFGLRSLRLECARGCRCSITEPPRGVLLGNRASAKLHSRKLRWHKKRAGAVDPALGCLPPFTGRRRRGLGCLRDRHQCGPSLL